MIIAGLGNPGKKYKGTRHNIGFEAVNRFAKENGFPEFKLSKKFNSLISKKENVFLLKPQAFMNNSGKALKDIRDYYNIATSRIIVVHDDIDLKIGELKTVRNRGSAGHKGIESIISYLKTKDFTRIRIGISPEEKPEDTESFVLQKFTEKERETIEESIKEASKILAGLAK